jgi:hypothetical protein
MDGNLDLVVANGNVYVTLGDGNGGFGPPTHMSRVLTESRQGILIMTANWTSP